MSYEIKIYIVRLVVVYSLYTAKLEQNAKDTGYLIVVTDVKDLSRIAISLSHTMQTITYSRLNIV